MHTLEWRYTCGCQCVLRVLACNNDMLFSTLAWLNTKLWDSRLHILYSELLTITSPLFIAARKKSALLNSMCVSHTVYLCYVSRIHIHILAGCFLEGKTVDLLLAMIASRKKSSHATEVFIMLIIHSNQRGTLYPYWRVQSLPAQGLSFTEASNKYSKQMLSSNWFKMWCI